MTSHDPIKSLNMPEKPMTRRHLLTVSVVAATLPRMALSQTAPYPDHPVRIVVPLAAGGGTDILARLLASRLGIQMGQTFIVENKAGAGTNIGADSVAKSAPDGYTLLSSSSTTFAFNASLYKKLSYDPAKDFAPIALTGRFALVLAVSPSVKASSIKELLALSKNESLDYASPGPGSPHHLAMELLKMRTGLQAMHIAYKGASPALQDVLGGRIPIIFIDYATGKPYIDGGQLKPIAVASESRLPGLGKVPTVSESGVPGFEASAWQGIVAPIGTPVAIINKLNAEVVKALRNDEFKHRLSELNITPIESTPEEFAAYARTETQKWRDVIRYANVTVD